MHIRDWSSGVCASDLHRRSHGFSLPAGAIPMGRLPAISTEGLHMSRHYFGTFHKGSPITVVLGWDRPMDYFFLVIEEETNSDDNPMAFDLLYSNLQESDPFNHDLDRKSGV